MKRRDLIAGLGGVATWAVMARAQRQALPIVGYLTPLRIEESQQALDAVRRGLAEIGQVEGRDFAFEYRSAENDFDRLPVLATELVQRRVAAIVAVTVAATLAAKAATQTIPIVFVTGADPIEYHLVESFNRPGGNVTGILNLNIQLAPKRLELLRELVPSATLLAHIVNPATPFGASEMREVQAAARGMGIRVLTVNATLPSDFEPAFTAITAQGAGALLFGADALFSARSDQLVALAAHYAMPAIYGYQRSARAGGLTSYGTDENDVSRLVGIYAGRILKGERPGDLPVQQATKIELIVNLKAAKALGINVPLTLLGRADEVIE
jgi:putative ABC transport system substrate-binding protein